MKHNKLITKWILKMQKGETIDVTDLYEFSRIHLKRNRMRKKFRKYYYKYVSEEIKQSYWGICLSNPLINMFKNGMDLNFDGIEPKDAKHKIKFAYLDYKYKSIDDNK